MEYIFIHINKCGGTSINKILDAPADVEGSFHRTIKDYQQHKNLDNFFKFCIVRNPYERLVSQYIHWKNNLQRFKNDVLFKDYISNYKSKDIYIDNWHIYHSDIYVESQYDWISIDGKMMMDYVGRFEKFKESMTHVFQILNVPTKPIPHLNKNKHSNYSEYYDDEAKKIAHSLVEKDLDYFKYTFDI